MVLPLCIVEEDQLGIVEVHQLGIVEEQQEDTAELQLAVVGLQ